MTDKKARRDASQCETVAKIRAGEPFTMKLPIIGQLTIPKPEQLVYYGGLAVLVALELIDWPIALVIASGHLLANNHHNQMLQELGEAMEDV